MATQITQEEIVKLATLIDGFLTECEPEDGIEDGCLFDAILLAMQMKIGLENTALLIDRRAPKRVPGFY